MKTNLREKVSLAIHSHSDLSTEREKIKQNINQTKKGAKTANMILIMIPAKERTIIGKPMACPPIIVGKLNKDSDNCPPHPFLSATERAIKDRARVLQCKGLTVKSFQHTVVTRAI